jgi:hypothetical protein
MSNQLKGHPLVLWEEAKGFTASFKALAAVCGIVLLKPADFFRQLIFPPRTDLKTRLIRAVVFALLLGYIKLFFDVLNLYWLKAISKQIFPVSSQWQLSFFSTAILRSPFFLLRPLIVFVLTLVLVVCGVKLVLGFDKAFLPALFVVCYMSTADLFCCIPLVGSMLAVVWSLTLIIIGIREVYGTNTFRSVFSALVMPLVILFLIVLSVGPSLNKMIVSFYPETEKQLAKLNEVSAYVNTAVIVSAAGAYEKDLGFYPVNLSVLRKYFPSGVSADLIDSRSTGGYLYLYQRMDDKHFILRAIPERMNESGRFVFYADETGKVRLSSRDGLWIENAEKMDRLIAGAGDKV